MSKFENAIGHILAAEGGYVNDPKDPGGETNYGISKRQYPDIDIKSLTVDQAKAIYERDYWDAIHGEELPWPLCLYVFDAAVNQGVVVAIGLLQRTLGIKRDGIIGPVTIETANRYDSRKTASLYLADRAVRYAGTDNFELYGRSWMRRLFELSMET